jgi:hypothetical protein
MEEAAATTVNLWLSTLVISHGLSEVAKSYLRLAPEESSAVRLRALLARQVATDGNDLARVIQADFARPDTVALDGWILSRTEARLAALRYLDS